jgi:hypothetical protein
VNRRRGAVGAIATLVLVAVAVGLVAVPLTEMEPRPPDRSFEVGDAPSFRVAGNISVDGRVVLGVESVVNESGASSVRVVEENVVSEWYRGRDADVEYRRLVLEVDRTGRRVAALEDDPDVTVLSVECGSETASVVSMTNATPQPNPPGAAAVVLTELRLAAYERVDAPDERGRRILRPRSGWYDGRRSYRLTGASGRVVLPPESTVVHSADVTWNQTIGTETYAHYLLGRNTTIEKTIRYRYRPVDLHVERPAWVEDVAEGEGTTGSDPDADVDCR